MDWKKKLASRKFWMALAALAVGVIAMLRPGTDTQQISGVIMSLGSVVAYIAGEGMVDSAAASAAEGSGASRCRTDNPAAGETDE